MSSRITDQDRAIYKIMNGRELCDSNFKTSWSIHCLKLDIFRFMDIMLDRFLFLEMRKEVKDAVPEVNRYKGREIFITDLLRNNYLLKRYGDSWYIDIGDVFHIKERNKTINRLESLDSGGFIKIVKRKYDASKVSRWYIEFNIEKLETYRNYCKLALEER